MLKTKHLRMTRQRSVILEELRQDHSHPSADEIYSRVRRRLPRISLGTVYRNLEVLCELGEIQKLEVGGTLKRFDANTCPHHHLRCIHCQRLVDVPLLDLNDPETQIEGTTDFTILGHRLEFLGLCPDCATVANVDPLRQSSGGELEDQTTHTPPPPLSIHSGGA